MSPKRGKNKQKKLNNFVNPDNFEDFLKEFDDWGISEEETPPDNAATSAATATPQGIGSESLGQSEDVSAENTFIHTLRDTLNDAMSESHLGAMAVVFWGEAEYQAMLEGVIAGQLRKKANLKLIDFYKSEVSLSKYSTVGGIKQNKDFELATKNFEQPIQKGDLSRADIVIRFNSGTVIFIELKYVPLGYLRLPKPPNKPKSHEVTLLFDFKHNTDTGAMKTKAEQELLAKLNNFSKEPDPKILTEFILKKQKEIEDFEKHNTFKLAPTVDQKYKEKIETLKKSNVYASEDDILLASLHNGDPKKPTVGKYIEEAGNQVVDYANILKAADPENARQVRAFVFMGVWRKTLIKEYIV